MNTFLVVAAVMAALAAAAVAVPVLRDRQSRVTGALAAVLVAGAAAGLYPLWSTWNWNPPPTAAQSPDVLAMVDKLEKHLRDEPNDLTGWLMLGRSYLALEKIDEGILAYDHAHRLDANNADASLGLGEAMSLRAGGEIPPPAAALFEDALRTAPNNPKALLYSGFAAAARGDNATARARWQALKDMHPPEQIEKMLDARIAELGAPGAGAAPGAAAGSGAPAMAAGPSAAPAGGAAAPVDPAAQVTVNIRIAPALKAKLTGEAPLFVFAREPGGRGPPLAAKRLTSTSIGTQIHLSAADSMIPGRVLVSGQSVSITARVSFSGQPLPAAGDLYGELTYDVGRDGVKDLVIDKVAE
jgi:cytochrome c-type biogenesis protein CcmH